ncbi:MAG: hypothetical protein WC655_09675, partial [Candidatus Hydrogenedentales bacterium]
MTRLLRSAAAAGIVLVAASACATHKTQWSSESIPLPTATPSAFEVPAPLSERADGLLVTAKPGDDKPIALTRDGALLT